MMTAGRSAHGSVLNGKVVWQADTADLATVLVVGEGEPGGEVGQTKLGELSTTVKWSTDHSAQDA
jgi:hypothetical protein